MKILIGGLVSLVLLQGAAPVQAQSKAGVLPKGEVENCLECVARIKRRVAVMPIKVGVLSNESGISSADLAERLVDKIEAGLRARKNVIVVNRQELGNLVAEQKLSSSALANKELAVKPGAVIPAELLLNLAIDRLDVAVTKRANQSSTANQFYREAARLDELATEEANKAIEAQNQLQRAQLEDQRLQQTHAQNMNSFQQQARGGNSSMLGLLGATMSQMGSQKSQDNLVELSNQARTANAKSLEYRQRAAGLRQRAQVEAETNVSETITYRGTMAVTWKAIDPQTGLVVASGTEREQDEISDQARVSRSGQDISVEQTSNKNSALVGNLIDKSVVLSARAIDQGLEKLPFRALVVAPNPNGVLINAGQNYGLEPGDAFEVFQKGKVLTDPSTGEVLSDGSISVAKVVVRKVGEKTATAEYFERTGTAARGNFLKSIGVFKPAN